MPDLSKLNMSSEFTGFKNYTQVSGSFAAGGYNLNAGQYARRTGTLPLNNSKAISQVQIKLNGLESQWRPLPGLVIYNNPVYNAPNFQVEVMSYYTGGNLVVDAYISNQTGGTISVPSFNIDFRAWLYFASFN